MSTFVWAAAIAGNWATGANWQVAGVPQAAAPTAADIAQFGTGTGATNSNCTTAAGDKCRDLIIDNAYTGTFNVVNNATGVTVGDASGGTLQFGSGATYVSLGANSAISLISTSNNGGAGWPVTFNGVSVPCALRTNGAGGRWTQQDNAAFSTGQGRFRITAGTYDTNGKNVLATASAAHLVDGGTLLMGSGVWTYTQTATGNIFTYTSGTVTGGSETHSLTGTGNNVRTFAGGGAAGGFGALQHNGASGTGALAVTGANTFTSLANVAGRTITLPAATTTTVSGPNGSGGIKGTLKSATAASAATISLTSLFVSVMRAVTLQDITVTPAGHAVALDASVSTSGNTGITFNQPFGFGIAT